MKGHVGAGAMRGRKAISKWDYTVGGMTGWLKIRGERMCMGLCRGYGIRAMRTRAIAGVRRVLSWLDASGCHA